MVTSRADVIEDRHDVQILLEVIDAMTSADGIEDALRRLAWIALSATRADRCAIFVADSRDETLLQPTAAASGAGDLTAQWKRFRRMEPVQLTATLRRELASSGAIAVEDVASSALVSGRWHKVWRSTSLALAPIRAGHDLIGLIAVDHTDDVPPFHRREVTLLEAIASAASTALRGARVVEQLQGRIRLTESLHRLSDAVAETTDLRAALSTLNKEVCARIKVECVRLSFADPALAGLLRVPKANRDELAQIRAWRRADRPTPQWSDDEVAFPVTMGKRHAGILHIHVERPLDAAGTELVAAIAAGIGEVALKAKLRRTAERRAQELAVAADRERIARDLHDTVGQTLHQIGVKLQDAIARAEPELKVSLRGLREQATQGVADIRSAVYALSFLHVRERGFVPSIRALARRFMLGTGIATELRVEGSLPSLGEDVEGALYRVVQEALVNVERHGRATGVVLSLAANDGTIELAVRDDGVGLSRREGNDWRSSAHFGIRSMDRAIQGVGGRFHIARAHPRGLLIRASVPVPQGSAR